MAVALPPTLAWLTMAIISQSRYINPSTKIIITPWNTTEKSANKSRVCPRFLRSIIAASSQYAPMTAKNRNTKHNPKLWLPFNLDTNVVWANKIPMVNIVMIEGTSLD